VKRIPPWASASIEGVGISALKGKSPWPASSSMMKIKFGVVVDWAAAGSRPASSAIEASHGATTWRHRDVCGIELLRPKNTTEMSTPRADPPIRAGALRSRSRRRAAALRLAGAVGDLHPLCSFHAETLPESPCWLHSPPARLLRYRTPCFGRLGRISRMRWAFHMVRSTRPNLYCRFLRRTRMQIALPTC